MIDAVAMNAACVRWHKETGTWADKNVRSAVETYLNALPKPETPYEQAILYRRLVGMD